MMRPNRVQQIVELATAFRYAMEAVDPAQLGELALEFSAFPRGACGDASVVLGQFLHDHGCGDFEYVSGKRSREDGVDCHAWIAQGATIVDITGDQFPGRPGNVYVGPADEWYIAFGGDSLGIAKVAMWGAPWTAHLARLYRCALEHVPPTLQLASR